MAVATFANTRCPSTPLSLQLSGRSYNQSQIHKKINFIKHFIKIKKNPRNSEEKDCKNWKEYTDRPAHPTLRVRLPLCRHSVSMEGRSSFQIHRLFSLHTHTHTLCSVLVRWWAARDTYSLRLFCQTVY